MNMLTQYIGTALWSSTDDKGDPLDSKYSTENLAPETKTKMKQDCAAFYEKAKALIEAEDTNPHSKHFRKAEEMAGHDFWLTRNGHGAGFWDGDWEQGDELTRIAKEFKECDLYVGDDGLLYVQ